MFMFSEIPDEQQSAFFLHLKKARTDQLNARILDHQSLKSIFDPARDLTGEQKDKLIVYADTLQEYRQQSPVVQQFFRRKIADLETQVRDSLDPVQIIFVGNNIQYSRGSCLSEVSKLIYGNFESDYFYQVRPWSARGRFGYEFGLQFSDQNYKLLLMLRGKDRLSSNRVNYLEKEANLDPTSVLNLSGNLQPRPAIVFIRA